MDNGVDGVIPPLPGNGGSFDTAVLWPSFGGTVPWQMPVTIGLAISGIVLMIWLYARQRMLDRINLGFYLPFVLQYLVSSGIWLTIDPRTEGSECSSTNRALSFVGSILTLGIPMWWAWACHVINILLLLKPEEIEADDGALQVINFLNLDCVDKHKLWPRRKLLGLLATRLRLLWAQSQMYFVFGVFYHIMRAAYPNPADWEAWSLGWFFPGPVCTIIAPTGFQVWPLAVYPHWLTKAGFLGVFGMVGSAYNFFAFPSFVTTASDGCCCIGFFILFWVGGEWASIWSMIMSCGFLAAFLEPMLFRNYRVLDAEAMAPEGEAVRNAQGYLFALAWRRFGVFQMEPWGKAAQIVDNDAEVGEAGNACCAHDKCCAHPVDDGNMKAPPVFTM